jgi:hypothetical protein
MPSITVQEKIARINMQTDLIRTEINEKKSIENSGMVNQRKMYYQLNTIEELKRLNTLLIYFYYVVVVTVYIIIYANVYFKGLKRDYKSDIFIFILFCIYPAIIYPIETNIYDYFMNWY